MTHASVKVRQVGGSAGVLLPKEILDELHAVVRDTLHLVRTERGFELTAFDPAFEEAMAGFEVIRRKHRNAFRELAK
jgi:antitoxin MazE